MNRDPDKNTLSSYNCAIYARNRIAMILENYK